MRNATTIVTGSHAAGLRRGAERLPGRRGSGTNLDIQFYPLSFREYVIAHYPELATKIPRLQSLDASQLIENSQETILYNEVIYPLFESFLRTGGFPRSIRDMHAVNSVKPDTYRLYKDAFIGDLTRLGRRETLVKELCQWITTRRENPFEWVDVARETYIGTHPTVREYIEDAEAAFVWNVLYKIKQMGKPLRAPRSPKRIYFADPFIFHTLRAWALGYEAPFRTSQEFLEQPSNRGYLVETVVSSLLKRLWKSNVFYWRNSGEIDFVVFYRPGERMLLEVKYQTRINHRNGALLKKWGGGIILSKKGLREEDNVFQIPVPVFLAMLG